MKNRQGFILIAVLMIMVVVSLLVIGTAFTSIIDRSVAANQRGATDAYYIAKAGAEKYKTVAFQTYRYYLKNLDEYQDELQSGNSACGNFLRIGLDLNRDGDLTDAEDFTDGKTLGPFTEGSGTYTVKLELDGSGRYLVLTSVGRVGRSRSTVQLVLEARNAGTTGYALYVGNGQVHTDEVVRGGVNLYGNAYFMGNEDDFKDFDPNNDYVVASDRDFLVHNFYQKSTLTTLLQSNSDVHVDDFLRNNFHDQRNLCSTLRVKDGKVKVGGKVGLGDAVAPSSYTPALSGVHVGEGYANDVSGADSYADLKTALDIQKVSFPSLDQEVCKRDPTKKWRKCLTEDAENLNPDVGYGDRRGLVIKKISSAYEPYWDPTHPVVMIGTCDFTDLVSTDGVKDVLTFGEKDIDCTGKDTLNRLVGFKYTYPVAGEPGILEAFGLVNFQGTDITLAKNVKVKIDGEATFFVEGGDVVIAKNLLPSNLFPYQKDVLGIIAENNFTTTGPAGQVVAGVFYAGEQADIAAGATVFGTVITKKLCVAGCSTNQTANFVKIPDLEYNLPPGFSQLTDATVPTFRVASFERR